jgi:hypothetical protein
MAICEGCRTFYVVRNGTRGRFCSMKCVAQWRTKTLSGQHPYSRSRGGRRADLGNRYFRSGWEANWARYLNWLQSIGEIQSWEYESITFEFHKIRRGTRFYTPDFKIHNKDGSIEYHEIKGWMDIKSATKIKRMAKYYPDVRLLVIGHKEYGAVSRKAKGMVPGWETTPKKAY